ncbi:MAG TPA: bifunctional DNA primase/polymerase [Verrucomicrobiae bacterium]|nr:bifunctional DNA primase/polymerase [Verrucomicrobiae bacterium]
MSNNPNPIAQAANDYIAAGWKPLPLRPLTKQPIGEGWQNTRLTADDVPQTFCEQDNIGLLLGEASANLVDFDLDSAEAIALAPAFLPATGFVSGRASKPRSHQWYRGESVPDHKKFEFEGACLLELRSRGQTMCPPSLHPSGEQVIWHEAMGELPTVSADELGSAARKLAAATLLTRHYPRVGSRHGFALALSGFLLRQGWSADRVRHFVVAIATAAGDEELEDRQKAIETTLERLESGQAAWGGTRLSEIIGGAAFEKVCEWLGFTRSRFEVLSIIEAAKVEDERIPEWPVDCLEGDLLSDLTYELFKGTPLPPAYLRESAVMVLGSLIEGKAGIKEHRDLSTRRYLCLVSELPQSGKGASWQRIGGASPEGAVLRQLIEASGVKVLSGSGIGSGQFLAATLEENPRAICVWDEVSHLFQVSSQQASTLLSSLKTLYESTSLWTGSFTNRKHGTDDAHLSILLHSTRKTFRDGLATRNAVGDGFLSRVTLCYSDQWPAVPIWAERNFTEERRIVQQIAELIPRKFTLVTLDAGALEQLRALGTKILARDFPHPEQTRRLLEMVKSDALIRAVFSASSTITAEMMERSVLWGHHQLALRLALWPNDAASRSEAITQVLLKRLRKGSASANDLRRAANVDRDGSHQVFSTALSALRRSGALVVLGKNRKQQEIYGLEPDDDGTTTQ